MKEPFLNGTCPINVKHVYGIEEVMEYVDHHHEDFLTSSLAWDTIGKKD
jgi:hypothetical protein